MSVPALQALRAQYPQARISILARPWVAGLYGREAFCDEVIPYEAQPGWIGARAKYATALALRERQFQCAVLLQNAFEAAAVVWLARIPVRIGYDRDARGLLLTDAIPVPKPGEIPKHQRFYYLELLKRAGMIDSYDTKAPIQLQAAKEAAAAGQEKLKSIISAGAAIGVSPGAAYGGAKRWLPERFAEAAIEICKNLHTAALVMGSQAEYEICDQVRAMISNGGVEAVNLAGKTGLECFIDLAAACRLILTNDSGSMHIGSALGVPTVTVFGATDEHATGPTGELARIVREPVECSPCLLRECPIDHRCMTRVDAQRVVNTALEVLHGR